MLLKYLQKKKKDKYDLQVLIDFHETKYESWYFYWNFNQTTYFNIDKDWRYILEYARTMKSNHPHLIYKRMKVYTQSFYTRNDTYNGLTPYQCLLVTNKTHYAADKSFSVVDLTRIMQVKSKLRINSLSGMIKAREYFDLNQQLFMAYFTSKVYIYYHKSCNDKDSKLSEKIGKVQNGK